MNLYLMRMIQMNIYLVDVSDINHTNVRIVKRFVIKAHTGEIAANAKVREAQ